MSKRNRELAGSLETVMDSMDPGTFLTVSQMTGVSGVYVKETNGRWRSCNRSLNYQDFPAVQVARALVHYEAVWSLS